MSATSIVERAILRAAVRFVFIALACAGCATPKATPRAEVDVAPPVVPSATAPERCVVSGGGELRIGSATRGDFWLHEDRERESPLLRVHMTDSVGAEFTRFPPADRPGRTHVVLGGGSLPAVRVEGWTAIGERVFVTRRDTIVVPSHVWLVGGLEVKVRGARGDGLEIERPSAVVTGERVVAEARCADLTYERDRVDPEITVADAPPALEAKDGSLALRSAPGSAVVYAIHARRMYLAVSEHRGGWVHVSGTIEVLRFDGWIPEEETTPLTGKTTGRLGGSHQTRPPMIHRGRDMLAAKETTLYLGRAPEDARAIGTIEVQAHLDVTGHGKRAQLTFTPPVVVPPDDLFFFADDADLGAATP